MHFVYLRVLETLWLLFVYSILIQPLYDHLPKPETRIHTFFHPSQPFLKTRKGLTSWHSLLGNSTFDAMKHDCPPFFSKGETDLGYENETLVGDEHETPPYAKATDGRRNPKPHTFFSSIPTLPYCKEGLSAVA